MKHLLTMEQLSEKEILSILELADQLKYERKHHIEHPLLKGKSIGLIFQKSSTRTRVSFETGAYQLGAQPLFLSSRDLQIGRGEPVQDTARVLSRYLDCIMIRTYEQKEVEDLANFGSIPVINGLTDYCHPCQVLADLMTIREKYGLLKGLKMCYIGDGDNMANSLIVGGLKVGMKVSVATPKGYEPDKHVLEFAKDFKDFELTNDCIKAIQNADVVITNPTHLAVAIRYDKEKHEAPVVVAKGADYLAAKIKETASNYQIEIVENKPLARMLYHNVEIGAEIPPELYQMVAEVLAYVYNLKGKTG